MINFKKNIMLYGFAIIIGLGYLKAEESVENIPDDALGGPIQLGFWHKNVTAAKILNYKTFKGTLGGLVSKDNMATDVPPEAIEKAFKKGIENKSNPDVAERIKYHNNKKGEYSPAQRAAMTKYIENFESELNLIILMLRNIYETNLQLLPIIALKQRRVIRNNFDKDAPIDDIVNSLKMVRNDCIERVRLIVMVMGNIKTPKYIRTLGLIKELAKLTQNVPEKVKSSLLQQDSHLMAEVRDDLNYFSSAQNTITQALTIENFVKNLHSQLNLMEEYTNLGFSFDDDKKQTYDEWKQAIEQKFPELTSPQ
jgi:hypothetical protein